MKKRIIIFCDYFGNGGIEKISTYIKNNIDKSKFETELLCTINNSQVFDDEVKCMSNKKYRNPIYRFIKTILKIKQYTKNADVINLNIHSSVELFYAFILREQHSKIVIYAHNSNFDNDTFKFKKIISVIFKKLLCNKKYTYIACSEAAAEFCFKKKTKYSVVKSEIDCERFLYNEEKRIIARKRYNIGNNTIIIGNIGRLCKQKNQQFLVKVFIEFNKLEPNSMLFIIGNGKEEKKIARLIKKYNMEDKICLIKEAKNIEEFYQMFDCYVSTSKYEGYGLTINEAINASLKCFISSNISNFKNKNIIRIELSKPPCDWAKIIYKEIYYPRIIQNIDENNQYIKQIEKIYME